MKSIFLKRQFVSFALLSLIVPVAVPVVAISGKPIYIIPSDILYILGAIAFFAVLLLREQATISVTEARFVLLVLFCSVSLFAVGAAGSMLSDTSVPVLSSLKLVKVNFFFLFGIFFSRLVSLHDFLCKIAAFSVFLVWSLLLSDIFLGNFPYPRLGGAFWGIEIYGFPNSPAVFYTAVFAFCVVGFLKFSSKACRLLAAFACVILLFIIVGTLSRAAMLNLLCFVAIMSALRQRYYFSGLLVGSFIMILVLSYLFSEFPNITSGLASKFAKFQDGADVSNGRFGIWADAIRLVADSPLLGNLFDPFSNYSDYDTPHNQFLEIFFKAGMIGLILFFLPYFISLIVVVSDLKERHEVDLRIAAVILVSLFLAFLVTNLVQPNFSYTPIGVLLSFLCGYLFSKVSNKRSMEL
ncbi:O-antigen ligase family protein [Marinobacter nauticus]|uniref:O-antigen ligase family protein n=1 Tax=Marinobacter nauticus TaxID=2743 RepID=UPI001CFE6080|nr:O-antigen ligase family protein [Marinobacter nauticus]